MICCSCSIYFYDTALISFTPAPTSDQPGCYPNLGDAPGAPPPAEPPKAKDLDGGVIYEFYVILH